MTGRLFRCFTQRPGPVGGPGKAVQDGHSNHFANFCKQSIQFFPADYRLAWSSNVARAEPIGPSFVSKRYEEDTWLDGETTPN